MAQTIDQQKFELHQLSERRLVSNYPRDLTIVAEGDSWFDYPLKKDVIDHLVDKGYAVKNYAKAGDTVENMIYGTAYRTNGSQITHRGPVSLQRTLTAIRSLKPQFFLFSGGGNDIVGAELVQYLNHKNALVPELINEAIFQEKLAAMRAALTFLIESVSRTASNCQIIMDGYDYAKVTGKGYSFIGINLKGPWILPAMGTKAITQKTEHEAIIKKLIDGYNEMLTSLDTQYPHFHHVDLRGMFPHTNSWDNEIHLKSAGFKTIADVYAAKMHEILNYDPIIKHASQIIA